MRRRRVARLGEGGMPGPAMLDGAVFDPHLAGGEPHVPAHREPLQESGILKLLGAGEGSHAAHERDPIKVPF